MSRFEAVGNNALTLLILVVFFFLIYSKVSGKKLVDAFNNIRGLFGGK